MVYLFHVLIQLREPMCKPLSDFVVKLFLPRRDNKYSQSATKEKSKIV